MGNIVLVKNNELFTTTLAIAEGVDNDHETIMRLLKKYSYLDSLSGFEIGELKTKGRPLKIAYLSELQATLLIVLMKNSEKVIGFKEKLTKEFFKQRKFIMREAVNRQNEEWLKTRNDTKKIRKECTDVIQKFIEYAKEQGSKSAEKYYMNLSRMELSGLFIIERQFPNARDVMSIRQLNLIEMADEAIAISLKDSMSKKIPYKECYQIAKEKICALASIFPKSPLPALLSKD